MDPSWPQTGMGPERGSAITRYSKALATASGTRFHKNDSIAATALKGLNLKPSRMPPHLIRFRCWR